MTLYTLYYGLIFPIGPIWTRLSTINQFFYPPDCRPESPPIAPPPFLTRMSPDQWTMAEDDSRMIHMFRERKYQQVYV